MKIESMNPVQSLPSSNANPSAGQQSARDRAIARLTQQPVPDATRVSPEELGAVQAQKPPVEEAPEAPKAETKAADEPLSSQYAMLARKEKAIRQREQQLRAREQAIRTSQVPKAPVEAPIDISKYISRDELTRDPLGVLTQAGLTFDQITEAALNGPKPREQEMINEIKAMREELKVLKGDTENTKKSFAESQQQSYKQALSQIRSDVNSLVSRDPSLETIKETNSMGDVVDLIERTFQKDGTLLSVEDAAQQVEEYLVEEAYKLTKLKKIQQRLAPAQAPVAAQPAGKQSQMKTLTNSVGAARQLSSRERALLAFEGKLNK